MGRRPMWVPNQVFWNIDSIYLLGQSYSVFMNDEWHFNVFVFPALKKKGRKHIEGMLFSGILIPYSSKLVSGTHKIWFDDPYFCLLYQFIISSTNPLISTVYWLLISWCLLRGDLVPYFWKEGYKSIPVLSFFTYSVVCTLTAQWKDITVTKKDVRRWASE